MTGEQSAYRYLESSAAKFPCGEDFVALMREAAAFGEIEVRELSFGIAYLYKAIRT